MSAGACPACLRRAELVGFLSARISGALGRRTGRVPGLLALPEGELIAAVGGSGGDDARRFLECFDPGAVHEQRRRQGIGTSCVHRDGYPAGLAELDDPPAALYFTGPAERFRRLLDAPAVALVGARRASPYAIQVARALGHDLAASGVSVVSGLALGVDGETHEGALDATGAAVAVVASGPDVTYPPRHRSLHRRVRERGVVLSELPPGAPPRRWAFPARNRIMAGLAALTVVVEAAESSGSLITADFAADLGRVVAAVPGRVTQAAAAGSNRLLRDGAAVVRGAEDVLDLVLGPGVRPVAEREPPPLDPALEQVLDAVEAGEAVACIAGRCALAPGRVRASLGRLEALGFVVPDGLGGYERTAAPRGLPMLGRP